MVRKEDDINNWLTAREAAKLLAEQSGHPVTDAYVRRLGNPNGLALFATRQVGSRLRLYSRKDIEKYQVGKKGDGSVRRQLRPNEYKEKAAEASS
jgi:hypothetical protein